MVHLMEACLLTALQAYLLGSLLFGVLVSKLFYHDDVRLHGSGNAGMTNVMRTLGWVPSFLTFAGDALKGHRRCGQKCGCRQAGAVYL